MTNGRSSVADPRPGDARARPAPGAAELVARAVAACRVPEPFEPSEAPFWDDPHIGPALLATHLDDAVEAASRSGPTMDRAVAWLAEQGLVGPGVRVLDLGCGPGLVAERLARVGCRVTGVDLSSGSLAHARASADRAGLAIDYRRADFRELADVACYDVVLQSFGELSTFAPAVRDDLLARVRRALVPGGAFVFDASTPHLHPPTGRTWEASDGGFWRPGPHLVLSERFVTPADDGTQLACDQYVVVDGDVEGGVTTYRMWFHDHTRASLTAVVEAAGFVVEDVRGALTGEPATDDSAWLAVVARTG